MKDWLRTAFSGPIVRRGIGYAVVVGALLGGINHGDVILAGTVTTAQWTKIGLTLLVPYCVSVLSSVSALRQAGVVVESQQDTLELVE